MEKRFGKLIGKIFVLCAVFVLLIGAKVYAQEELAQTGFELISEDSTSITESLEFTLKDAQGESAIHQSQFGYLVMDVVVNKTYTLSLKENQGYTMSDIVFKSTGTDPLNPDTGEEIGKLVLKKVKDTGTGEVSEGKALDSITIVTYKDDEILKNSQFRLFRVDGGIPNMIANGSTDDEGKYVFSDFEPEKEYTLVMTNPSLKFDKDSITFVTDKSAKVVKINSKTIKAESEGLIEFRGYAKSSDKLNTTEFEFYVVDAETNNPVPDVELTANTIVPRLSSYKNVKSDANGIVKFKLEGQEGGKTYVVCVSKNAQFLWKFEPDQITIHVDENGEVTVDGDVYPIFKVTKEDRLYLKNDLENKIADAKKYITENKFSNEAELKKLEQVIEAARAELDKPETIPFYVEGFIKSIDEAKKNLEKYVLKEEKKEEKPEDKKEEKPESKEEKKEQKPEVKEEKKEETPQVKEETNTYIKRSHTSSSLAGGGSHRSIRVMSNYKKPQANAGKWILDGKGWWYRRADGTYPKDGWIQDKGKWYCFDSEGYMKKGWVLWNEKWYYLGENGDMLFNTITPDGYKLDKNGVYVA